MPLHFSYVGDEKLFFQRLWIWPLRHTFFCPTLIFAICGCWLCGFCFCRSVFDTWGAGELIDFWGAVLPLNSWLLRLLLLFDYQNSCLLFLKLQVQDQNDYFWQTVWGLFSKILPTFVLGISCLTVWICQIKFYALILFICGFLFICDLVICNLNFSSVIWGVKQTPGKWMLGCIECRWICPSRFVCMFIFLICHLGVFKQPPGNEW
jgi:hypothetical protein